MTRAPQQKATRSSNLIFAAGLVAVVFSIPGWSAVTTFYVDRSVATSGDGKSWAAAFKKVQEGVDAASDGDTVIVAQGTYVESVRFKGKNVVLRSTDPLDPSVVAQTIIDGKKIWPVIVFDGIESERCALSGFTIRNGVAGYGGGIFGTRHNRATIQNNVITGNSALWGAGVLSCDGLISNNIIKGNSAGQYGGGLAYCNGIIENNTISNNSAQEGGGLAYCHGSIQNNTISHNSVTHYGGGLSGCEGVIQNNRIEGNSAENGAGVYHCGGRLVNNLIIRNSAVHGGGIYHCGGAIQNNTITGNSADYGGGICLCPATIRNNIIWGNTARLAQDELYETNVPSFSCIRGWTGGGTGNISDDPRFVDADAGDYRLGDDSPCIDTGINHYWFTWPHRDFAGNSRLVGSRVDMGCYEHGATLDSDGDLFSDEEETHRSTDPYKADSDGDSLRDGLEVIRRSDPLAVTVPRIIKVPSDARTIQRALSFAVNGDEIVVSPGTYPENIHLCGTDVILRSSNPDDPTVVASTIIDGSGLGPTVSFTGDETPGCVLSGFTITGGSAKDGGGVYGGGEGRRCHATIQKNVIRHNTAYSGAGGSFCDGVIRNNRIFSNYAQRAGGGLSHCRGRIEGNLIAGNIGTIWGGGLKDCPGLIQNNTIVSNSALGGGWPWFAGFGGGLHECPGIIRNCIFWGNTAQAGSQVHTASTPTYSCIQDWTDGEGLSPSGYEGNIASDDKGNIAQAPAFVDPDGPDNDPSTYDDNDYRLSPDSPCIDAGDDSLLVPPGIDLDGNLRIALGKNRPTTDMGAYEYNSIRLAVSGMLADGSGVRIIWNSQVNDYYVVWSRSGAMAGAWIKEAIVGSLGGETLWVDPAPVGRIKVYRVEMVW